MTDDPYLRFAHPNVGYVLDGIEDMTVRVDFDRRDELDDADIVRLLTPGGTQFARATVVNTFLYPVRLVIHDAVRVDGRSHPADDAIDLLERLRDHYPDADIDLDTRVTAIYFDLLGDDDG